jgi:hemerythrin-like metal-binding protein
VISLNWNSSLVIGHQEIDSQHKEILEKMRQIYNKVLFHDSHKDILKQILELRSMARDHMDYEESYMTKIDNDDFERHRLSHEAFLAKFDQYISQYETDELMLTTDILLICKDFFYDHILKNDIKLKDL